MPSGHRGAVCDGIEGFCILLRRLAYPCRYFDLIQRFARPTPELSLIANTVLEWIYDLHGFRLTSWNQAFLTPPFLESYAQAVERQGSPLRNCFGFIDGTVREIIMQTRYKPIRYSTTKTTSIVQNCLAMVTESENQKNNKAS